MAPQPSDYHTCDELNSLGERIRDKAIQISIEKESAQVVQRIHVDHANDPLLDPSGHVADNPPITEETIRAWSHRAYQNIPQLFTAFATPDPARAQPMIDNLWGVAYALEPRMLGSVMHSPLENPIPAGAWHPYTSVQTRVQQIKDARLNYWDGEASDSFKANYLDPLAAKVTPQSELAAALALTLTAHQHLRSASHNNIWQVGQETLKVLDSLHACHPHDAVVTLTVFTAAIAVLLAVPTDGWSLAGAFGLAMAVKGFGQAAAEAKKALISGKTVYAVIISMADVITTLTNGIDQQEQDIDAFLGKIASQVTPDDLIRTTGSAMSQTRSGSRRQVSTP